MAPESLTDYLTFLQKAENLKNTLRSAHTSAGRQESSAEHSWRLCLMLIAFERELSGLDMAKLLKMAVIHDLAEAVCGDVPAVEKAGAPDKSAMESRGMREILSPLPRDVGDAIYSLWEEYENAASPEAETLKGLDKLETIIQHNQGDNPADFDYAFNLTYGQEYMDRHPLMKRIRGLVDESTRRHAGLGHSSPE